MSITASLPAEKASVLECVLWRCKMHLVRHRLNFIACFSQHDSVGDGVLLEHEFRAALQNPVEGSADGTTGAVGGLSIPVSDAELDCVCECLVQSHPNEGVDGVAVFYFAKKLETSPGYYARTAEGAVRGKHGFRNLTRLEELEAKLAAESAAAGGAFDGGVVDADTFKRCVQECVGANAGSVAGSPNTNGADDTHGHGQSQTGGTGAGVTDAGDIANLAYTLATKTPNGDVFWRDFITEYSSPPTVLGVTGGGLGASGGMGGPGASRGVAVGGSLVPPAAPPGVLAPGSSAPAGVPLPPPSPKAGRLQPPRAPGGVLPPAAPVGLGGTMFFTARHAGGLPGANLGTTNGTVFHSPSK